MKQLLEVNKEIWANVKHYATINETTVSIAVEELLKLALKNLTSVTLDRDSYKNART